MTAARSATRTLSLLAVIMLARADMPAFNCPQLSCGWIWAASVRLRRRPRQRRMMVRTRNGNRANQGTEVPAEAIGTLYRAATLTLIDVPCSAPVRVGSFCKESGDVALGERCVAESRASPERVLASAREC